MKKYSDWFLMFLVLVVIVAMFFLATGCATKLDETGPYAGDTILYTTDQTLATSYDVIDSFLLWERKNHAVASKSAQDLAERLRVNAPGWFSRALVLRSTYVSNPTEENRLNLEKVLTLIRSALVEVTAALVAKDSAVLQPPVLAQPVLDNP